MFSAPFETVLSVVGASWCGLELEALALFFVEGVPAEGAEDRRQALESARAGRRTRCRAVCHGRLARWSNTYSILQNKKENMVEAPQISVPAP